MEDAISRSDTSRLLRPMLHSAGHVAARWKGDGCMLVLCPLDGREWCQDNTAGNIHGILINRTQGHPSAAQAVETLRLLTRS